MDIEPSTEIFELYKAGIVPDWLYHECDSHGMYEAENILCEYDWEWGWDLGDGMSHAQLNILAEVRESIRRGIDEFQNYPEKVRISKERREKSRMREEKVEELKMKFSGYLVSADLSKVADYYIENGKLPIFYLLFRYIHDDKRSMLQRAMYAFHGLGREEPITIKEATLEFAELKPRQFKKVQRRPPTLYGKSVEFAGEIPDYLPDRPIS